MWTTPTFCHLLYVIVKQKIITKKIEYWFIGVGQESSVLSIKQFLFDSIYECIDISATHLRKSLA